MVFPLLKKIAFGYTFPKGIFGYTFPKGIFGYTFPKGIFGSTFPKGGKGVMRTISRHIDCLKINVDFVVGTNAQENHDIIDAADPEDLWFHISGHPSCHVISKIPPGIEIDKKELQKIAKQGAVVCKEMSGFKKEKNVKIDYTAIKHVTKGEKPGSVYITNGKQIII